jgi:hypothetical protein
VGRKKVTDSTDENLIQGVRDIRTFFSQTNWIINLIYSL